MRAGGDCACGATIITKPIVTALLIEALAFRAAEFDGDEPVSGADLTEWFAGWRLRLRQAIADGRQATDEPG